MSNLLDLPKLERPYEKLKLYGAENLSDIELLSIIISTGTKKKTSIEIAQEVVKKEGLKTLLNLSVEELSKIDGIGTVKAIHLKAIAEISKRILKPCENKIKISSKIDVINLVGNEIRFCKSEVLKAILLNNQNYVLKIKTIAIGSESNIIINTKSILMETLKCMATKIILVHNHPSGNAKPSNLDIEFTDKFQKAARLIDIVLLDHIIVSENGFESI